MIESFRDKISKGVYDEFGNSFMIYVDGIDSEPVKPCFSISTPNTKPSRTLNSGYTFDVLVSIVYIPVDSTEEYTDCINTQFRLIKVLRKVDSKKARNISCVIQDNTLIATANYTISAVETSTDSTIKSMDIQYERSD